MIQRCSIALQRLLLRYIKNKQSGYRLLINFARGGVAELLMQGQMTGLCTRTESPFLTTFYFLSCKGRYFIEVAKYFFEKHHEHSPYNPTFLPQ